MIEPANPHLTRGHIRPVGVAMGTPAKPFIGCGTACNLKNQVVSDIGNVVFFNYIQNRL